MSSIRRSARSRKHAATIYDDAKAELRRVSPKRRKKHEKIDSDDETEVSHVVLGESHIHDGSSTISSSSEESEVAPKKRKKILPLKIHVQFNLNKKGAAKKKNSKIKLPAAKGASKSRLIALRKKTLDPEETPQNSLTAAILFACTAGKKKGETTDQSNLSLYPDAFVPTEYTEALEPVAKKMLAMYQENNNKGHVFFLNFLFRSVGGSYAATLDPATTCLEDMDDDQWEQLVTSIVDDMRHTPHDAILISSCPKGAVHAHDSSKHNIAQEEYRRIFDHFWYVLGALALSNSSTSATGSSFDIERVRELACQMMELITVGQPDLRSAAAQSATMLALAACDWTLSFHTRLATARRQLNAAKAAKTSTKEKALEQTVTALERSLKDLEHVVTETIVPAVFMRRYRDSDPHIRAFCLDSLGYLIHRRPDIFLKDIYTKYPSWMMSDKETIVRVAAFKTLLLPFEIADQQKKQTNIHPLQIINPSVLKRVMEKFLPRITDCVLDISTDVQVQALKLILALMRNGLMDDIEDENTWNKINLRALSPDATPEVRRYSLYFILEQLEAFDVGSSQKSDLSERQKVFQIDSIAVWTAHALSDGRIPIECLRVNLVDFLVQSFRDMPEHTHLMTDWGALVQAIENDTEIDSSQQRVTAAKQRVLLQMLATAAAMEVGALNAADDANGIGNGIIDEGFIKVQMLSQPPMPVAHNEIKKKKKSDNITRESLTVALLKALPKLLESFRGNVAVLRSLTSLPCFFAASVVTLPQRKHDVQTLTKLLGDMFLEATDVTILQNACLALTVLAKGDHARNQEALLKLKGLSLAIQDRLFQLYQQDVTVGDSTSQPTRSTMTPQTQETRGTRASGDDPTIDGDVDTTMGGSTTVGGSTIGGSTTVGGCTTVRGSTIGGASIVGSNSDARLDQQHAILCCVRRLRILSKRWYLGVLLSRDALGTQDESTAMEESDPSIHLCSVIAKVMAKDLKIREIVVPEDDDDSLQIPDIWDAVDPRVHQMVAASIGEGLQLILAITAWRLFRAMNRESLIEKQEAKLAKEDGAEDDDGADGNATMTGDATVDLDASVRSIARSRDGLAKLLMLCFDTHLQDVKGTNGLTKEHLQFSFTVQTFAGKVGADLRTLFPQEWDEAKSPLLRSCAPTDFQHIVGGFARFFRSQEEVFAGCGQRKGQVFMDKLFLPLARGLCIGWGEGGTRAKGGNRREAGTGISHIVHPCTEVAKAAGALNRTLKKIDPLRLIEAHMACLIQSYSDWLESEPEEPENDRPSEQEMIDFAIAEKNHEDAFKVLEQKAAKLSASLGVGKLSEEKLYSAMFGFVKEGIRYAFSTDAGGDDCLLLGCRLSFLLLVLKYLGWMKKKKSMLKQLCNIFEEKEDELRADPSFEKEVRQEDMNAVETFRMALGLSKGKTKKRRTHSTTVAMEKSDDEDENPLKTPQSRSSKSRMSQASSVRSNRSSTLSPLAENQGSDSDEDNVPIKTLKKRKLSTPIRQGPIDEGSDEDNVATSSLGAHKSRKMSSDATPQTQDEGEIHESSSVEDQGAKSFASSSEGVTTTPNTQGEEAKNNAWSDEE